MLSKNIKIVVCCVCGVLCLSHRGNCAKKNANDLAKINKEIKAKQKETSELEKKQKKISEEIKQTQNKMVVIAGNVKKYEKQLSVYDKQLADLRFNENILNKKIENNNKELIKIIAVFENIALVPKGYLFFSPSRIDTVFHSSILLSSLVEQLNNSRQEFKADLNNLVKLKDEIIKAKNSINSLSNKVKVEKNKIAELIKSKKSVQKQLSSEQKKNQRELKKLIAESKTIEEFLKKAEQLRKQKKAKLKESGAVFLVKPRKFSGSVPLPVDGKISTYFGEKHSSGVRAKGIYIKPRSYSQVISPSNSDVLFAGSFYGFKNLLILHSDDDYYVILGGMKNIFVEEGQNLLAGEPIGEMGDNEIYIEIRDRETPIDPLRYFKL